MLLDILTPLTPKYYIEIPQDPAALISWLVFLGVMIYLTVRNRGRDLQLNRTILLWLAGLSVLVLLFTPFVGIPIRVGQPLPIPGRPEEPLLPHLMFLAAVPWLLAGGVIGVLPSVMISGLAGILLAYLDTHSVFTPLIFMLVAYVFSRSVRQRYRTFFFRLLRIPLIAALFSLIVGAPVTFITLLLEVPGEIVVRINYAISQFPGVILALSGMVLMGGLFCMLIAWLLPSQWGGKGDFVPAPGEVDIKFRLYATVGPLLLILLTGLLISDWVVAENAARKMMTARLTGTAQVAAEGIPYFIETGQNLILQMAGEPQLSQLPPEAIQEELDAGLRSIPYFSQLVYLDAQGQLVASYPEIGQADLYPTPIELLGIDLALEEVRIQSYAIPPRPEGESARMSFFATVMDKDGNVAGVLWGRADIATNPFSQPFIDALDVISEAGGSGQIIGDHDVILYHTVSQRVMKEYAGTHYTTPTYYEGPAPDGTVQARFYQPVVGRQWAVLVTMPATAVQTIAWETAFPLLVIVLIAFLLIFIAMTFGLRSVVRGLEEISDTAEKVTGGDLSVNLPRVGTFGQLGRLQHSVNRMIESLRDRLSYQENLLAVSDQIGAHQKLPDSLAVVLRTALAQGAASARIVLRNSPGQRKGEPGHLRYGMGKHSRLYAYLDHEILDLTHTRGPLVMSDVHIGKTLNAAEGMPYPDSLISLPLKWQDSFFGVLWVAYQDRQWFGESEVDFFEDLAEKTALVIVTAKAVEDAAGEQKRCEAVLDTLPDPVLIFDPHGRLAFMNTAARDLPGIGSETYQGRQLTTIFRNEELLALFDEANAGPRIQEIEFNNGKTYHTLISAIRVDHHRSGMVCIFKDISRYKELDSLKSEFVATVSHELRSPLTLILGYAQILKLIGNMNEQQETYVGHIVEGVEEMKTLVKNLLDLGRLEAGDALEISKTAAGDIVHQVIGSLEVHAEQKNIQVNVAVPDEPIFLEADVTFLTQALKNLVENAIKFTPMGGKVDVGVRLKDQQVIFAVRDNGIGIAPLDQRRLFEKFYRPGVQNQNQRGSGLGLAIVKSIVERHGGKVWFESQLGKGSSFYVQMPVRAEF
jgi:PAS domain S-box-containing protein